MGLEVATCLNPTTQLKLSKDNISQRSQVKHCSGLLGNELIDKYRGSLTSYTCTHTQDGRGQEDRHAF